VSRTVPALAALLALLAGCASEPPAPPPPVRFAVIGAPALPGPDAGPTAEEALFEVVTLLSQVPDLDFVLVPGPLLATGDRAARDLLTAALGSLAGPVYAALGPDDGPRDALLEELGRYVPGHPGEKAYAGEAVGGLRPVVLTPDGSSPEPEGEAEPAWALAVHGPVEPAGAYPLTVGTGPLGLGGPAEALALRLPPLGEPPHVFALVRIEDGRLEVEWRTALGDAPPPSPPPARLPAARHAR